MKKKADITESQLLQILVDQRFNDGTFREEGIHSLNSNSLLNELNMLKQLYPRDIESPHSTYHRSYGNLSYNLPTINDNFFYGKDYINSTYPSRSNPVPGEYYGHPVNMSAEYSSASLSPFLDHHIPASDFLKRASIKLMSKIATREGVFYERVEPGSRGSWYAKRDLTTSGGGVHVMDYEDYYNQEVPGGDTLNIPDMLVNYSRVGLNEDYPMFKEASEYFRSIKFVQRPKRRFLTVQNVMDFTTTKVRRRATNYRPIFKRFDPIWLTHTYTVGNYEVTFQTNFKPDEIDNFNPERHPFRVNCTCPFWRWQGPEHWARKFLYLYRDPVGTATFPVVRDPKKRHGVCKHVYALFRLLARRSKSLYLKDPLSEITQAEMIRQNLALPE